MIAFRKMKMRVEEKSGIKSKASSTTGLHSTVAQMLDGDADLAPDSEQVTF
jgi:hypothetical protein